MPSPVDCSATIEHLEQPWRDIRIEADAGVANDKRKKSCFNMCIYRDATAAWRETNGIVKQIGENLT